MAVATNVKKENEKIVAITHTISFYLTAPNPAHMLHVGNYDLDMATIYSRLNFKDSLRELIFRYLKFNNVDYSHLNV